MNSFNKLDKIFIALTIVFGGLILFFPVHYLLAAFLGIAALAFLFLNPVYCYYTMIVLSTYIAPFATSSQQMPFNQTDILIAICFLSVFCRSVFFNQQLNLKTRLDKWFVFLLIIYFLAGITSLSHRGYQGFLNFAETITVFYLTVYFLRTKEIKLVNLIKVIFFIGIFQALYGILQSLTGSFGANFQSDRGYLGYLGLGSTLVWHGRGTFAHFNSLGPFLNCIFLFFLPINHFIVKNKTKGYIVLLILLFGIITTYSRGSLIALIAGSAFFAFQLQKNKFMFALKSTPFLLIILGFASFLKNTSYVSTLSERGDVWGIVYTAVTSNIKNLLLGTGLKSYGDAVWMYLPGNVPQSEYDNYFAHNFFLSNIVEIGILGLIVILAYLIHIFLTAYKQAKITDKFTKCFNISVSLIIFSIFFEGMFDHAFNMFVFQIWLYLFLGIMYYKNTSVSKEKTECAN
jgi:O-antigen ligase